MQNAADKLLSHKVLDQAISVLSSNSQVWARTSVKDRIAILTAIKDRLIEVAEPWAQTAARHKQIPEGSPLVGEEWISGPYTVMAACNGLITTLSQMQGKKFLDSLPVRKVSDSQISVGVLPHSIWDHLLLSGIKADVWMKKGVTRENLKQNTASLYDIRAEQRAHSVSLVLGAGNIAAIAPLDCFQKLFLEHSVVIMKMNPVNEYLVEFLQPALEPLISRGFLQIVTGGVKEGEYLCKHALIDDIHITGAEASHDAIVWGTGDEGKHNRESNTPKNTKRITSELGAVCPTIIVPGPWTRADIKFQAEQIATQKLHNSGFNCVACQTLILPQNWDQREDFIGAVKKAMIESPPRGLYYPGAEHRIDEFCGHYPDAEILKAPGHDQRRVVVPLKQKDHQDYAENTEVFAPVLGVMDMHGSDAETYLKNAISYCNEHLHGTLGANILVHPQVKRQLADRWNRIIGELKYGCIAVNAWTGLGFLTVQSPWGAFPGHTIDDIQSGTGFVHNTYMFDQVERCVIEAPFRPFPRNLLHGSFTLLPRPPWFVTNKKADKLGMLLTRFQHSPGWLRIPRIFWNALLG